MAHPLGSSLDILIERAYQTGYSLHGDLGLDPGEFASHVTRVVEKHLGKRAGRGAILSFIGNLHTNDLYLSVACAQRSVIAWNRFIVAYNKFINDMAVFVSPSADAARELAATVLVDMFLPDRGGRSRIGSYEGRSSLATWLRMVIANRAVNERERKWNSVERIEEAVDIPDLSGVKRIEESLRSSRYERIIENALRRACRELASRERLILMMRYSDGLQVSQIARLLGVYPSSVTRQLDRIQKKLRDNVIHILEHTHGLEATVIEECLADLIENPYYSILSIIRRMSQNDQ
jgi:RNA polymerase sigma-70 factor